MPSANKVFDSLCRASTYANLAASTLAKSAMETTAGSVTQEHKRKLTVARINLKHASKELRDVFHQLRMEWEEE